jgi:manganese efflux pump family protein
LVPRSGAVQCRLWDLATFYGPARLVGPFAFNALYDAAPIAALAFAPTSVSEAARIAAFVAPLGLDTLALAIALGLRGIAPLRPAIVFAIFEGCMPAIGAALAVLIGGRYAGIAVYLGVAILLGLGVHTIREALEDDEAERLDFGSLRSMALAGFAISVDELAVGFPIGTAGIPIPAVLVIIAVQAFVVTLVGLTFGRHLGSRAARAAGVGAGVSFILLAAWLAIEHQIIRR